MSFVPRQVLEAEPPPPAEEAPPPEPQSAPPSGFVPAQVQQAPPPEETTAPAAPPPPGPVEQAANAVGDFLQAQVAAPASQFVPQQIQDEVGPRLSGAVGAAGAVGQAATQASDALLRGDPLAAGGALLGLANQPFEATSRQQAERAVAGEGQVPTPQELLADPSQAMQVIPGWWNTAGPGAWAAGSSLEDYARDHPDVPADQLYEAWKAAGGLENAPGGVVNPLDETTEGNALQKTGALLGSIKDSAAQGRLGPFLKAQLVDLGNDPTVPAQIAVDVLSGGTALGTTVAGRAGLEGAESLLRGATRAGRTLNRAADAVLDPTATAGEILKPAARGVRNLGGLTDKSAAARQAMAQDEIVRLGTEHLAAREGAPEVGAVPPAPTATPNGAVTPPQARNTLYQPPATRPARDLPPSGRPDPYDRPLTSPPSGAVNPRTGGTVAPPRRANGTVPKDGLHVTGGQWLTRDGRRVAPGSDIDTSLRTTTRRIYDEMLVAPPEQFWDRFDALHAHADVPPGADGFYARWRGAMRQGLWLLDDWSERRTARTLREAQLPDGGVDWQRVAQLAQEGNANAKRAMAGKRAHDLYVHRIAGSADPDREVYNLLATYHLDQMSGRFAGAQYGPAYWKQRAEGIEEVLRDAGYTPSPQLLQRLSHTDLGALSHAEFPTHPIPQGAGDKTLAQHGVITLHRPDGGMTAIGHIPAARHLIDGTGQQRFTYGDPMVAQRARQRLDAMGLRDVAVKVERSLSGGSSGTYKDFLVTISREIDRDANFGARPDLHIDRVVDHEAIHALRELGLFTQEEWRTLVAEADRQLGPPYRRPGAPRETFAQQAERKYVHTYGNLGNFQWQDLYDQEAVAELYAHWRAGKALSPQAAAALQRIRDFLLNLVDLIRGTDAERVMRDIASGRIGRRERYSQDMRDWLGVGNERDVATRALTPEAPMPQGSPTPEQVRVSAAFGGLSIGQRQRAQAMLPVDAVMNGRAVPVSAQDLPALEELHDFRFGSSTRRMSLGDALGQAQDEVRRWVEMAQDPALQTGRAADEFARLSTKYSTEDFQVDAARLTPEQQHMVAAATVAQALTDALPKKAPRTGLLGSITKANNDFLNFRRRVQLYNFANIPRFVVQQHVGNAITTAIGGRPGTALHLLSDLRAYGKTNRFLQKPGTVSLFSDDLQRAMGVGHLRNVTQSNRAMLPLDALGRAEGGKVGNWLAPQKTVNWGKISDTNTRDTIFSETVLEGYRRINADLPGATQQWVRHYGLNYSDDEVGQVVRDFLAAQRTIIDGNTGAPHTTILGRTATFEPVWSSTEFTRYLREHLTALRDPVSLKTDDPLGLVIRRVGADATAAIKQVQKLAADAVDTLAFDWRSTNLDEGLQKFFMYHFWTSRAGGLYVKQALAHPWMLAAYGRMMDDFQAQADLLDAPDWLKGWFQFLNTPAGFSVWYSPTDLLGTMLTFADWQMEAGENPFDDLTGLGKARNGLPLLMNPLLDYGLYAMGAYGPDSQIPDLLGVGRMWTMGTDLLNLANAQGLLPAWVRAAGIGVDAAGNPVPLQPKKLNELYARLGNGLSSALKEITGLRPVPIPNTAASQQRSIAYILEQNFRTQYPGLPQGEIDRKVTDALADPGSAAYQAAWRQQAEMPFMVGGPAGNLPIAAQGALRIASPVQIWSATEQQLADSTMKGLPPSGAIPPRNLGSVDVDGVTYTAQELANLDPEQIDALIAEHPEVETVLKEAGYAFNAAKYGSMKTVAGRQLAEAVDDYYNETGAGELGQINADAWDIYWDNVNAGMSKHDAYQLREQYLSEHGTSSEAVDAAQAARDAYLGEHPEVAAYLDWKNAAYAKDADGNPRYASEQDYIDQLMASNPAYADYIYRNNFDVHTQQIDYDHALTTDAYLASQGTAPTIYEPISSPIGDFPTAASPNPQVSATTTLNVRAEPDGTADNILTQVQPGEPMTIIGTQGEWTNVSLDGKSGWVPSGYLQYMGATGQGLNALVGGMVGGVQQGVQGIADAMGGLLSGSGATAPLTSAAPAPALPTPTATSYTTAGGQTYQLLNPDGTPVTPNYGYFAGSTAVPDNPDGTRALPPKYIVYHYTAGDSIDDFIGEFMGDTNRASSNFVLDKDGTLYTLVPPDYSAWANGDADMLPADVTPGANFNQESISIEIVNNGNEPYTPEQIATLTRWTREMTARYGIAADHLIGHADVTSYKSDPGPYFPWDDMYQAAA